MNLPPPPQDDDPIITQFTPEHGQWEFNDDNMKRIDPKNGHTILHNYCKYINTTPLAVYRYLIETLGCDVNAQNENESTPLHYALRCFDPNKGGDITVLTYLLSQKGANGNIKDKRGETLLHYACEKINHLPLDIFKLLIETKGFDVNVQNNGNRTPLHYALRCFDPTHGGNITVLTYLLSQVGVNANTKGWNGNTLLHFACNNINTLPLDVFKLLIETNGCDFDSNLTPIHNALSCFNPRNGGDTKALTYLLSQRGVNGNIKNLYGSTLLHDACEKINRLPLEIFKLLIETMGCDVNVQDNYQNTPIHQALRYFNPNDGGDLNVLSYLINQKDINVSIKDESDNTLLHRVCRNINSFPLEIFKLLIERLGCDVNAQDCNKNTPLYNALGCFNTNWGGDLNVLIYLINLMGINVNIKNKFGDTLLHEACININKFPLEIFKLLIETLGCDINLQNNNKNTPLYNVLNNFKPDDGDNINVLSYLINQKDVNVKIRGNKGCNLLHSVCISNRSASAELNARYDTLLCQVVEDIVERYTQQILDEAT
jgi:ankyrin repeat protein